MRALIVGAVESTRVTIRAIADAPDWQPIGLITLPSTLSHRHSDFVDLTDTANAAGIDGICHAPVNSDEASRYVRERAPDYIFVIGSSQLCGQAFLDLAPDRVVGYHPAPLPRLRGRGVIPWTILLEEPITAGTLFLIDAGTDSGPIIEQRFFHVHPDETAASLYTRHIAVLEQMLNRVLAALAHGSIVPQRQDERLATYAARRRPEDGEIDWSESAATVWRTIRANGAPYPGARTTINGELLVIDAGEPVGLDHHVAAFPGQIVARGERDFVVCCGDRRGVRVTGWRSGDAAATALPPMHARLGPSARRAA
ncbi:MAG TPA: formyltransferase family protein [Sphingomonas sp.]|jgi:methionyl-tRNA formyltransferase|nr:formyltransferase family protein [Sphingomonas sp.]